MTVGSSRTLNVTVKKKPKVFVNQSGLVVRKLSDLADVDGSSREDGSLLIYDADEEKYKNSTLLDKQKINGGHF